MYLWYIGFLSTLISNHNHISPKAKANHTPLIHLCGNGSGRNHIKVMANNLLHNSCFCLFPQLCRVGRLTAIPEVWARETSFQVRGAPQSWMKILTWWFSPFTAYDNHLGSFKKSWVNRDRLGSVRSNWSTQWPREASGRMYSKSPTYKPSSWELSKMGMCVHTSNHINEFTCLMYTVTCVHPLQVAALLWTLLYITVCGQ